MLVGAHFPPRSESGKTLLKNNRCYFRFIVLCKRLEPSSFLYIFWGRWCRWSCLNEWNYELGKVQSDFHPPYKTIWKACDWQRLRFSAWHWSQPHSQCSKPIMDRKQTNNTKWSTSSHDRPLQSLDFNIIIAVWDHIDRQWETKSHQHLKKSFECPSWTIENYS